MCIGLCQPQHFGAVLAYVGIFYMYILTVWYSLVFSRFLIPLTFGPVSGRLLFWEHPPTRNLSGSARSGGWVELVDDPSTLGLVTCVCMLLVLLLLVVFLLSLFYFL